MPRIQLSLTTRKAGHLLGWASRTQEWHKEDQGVLAQDRDSAASPGPTPCPSAPLFPRGSLRDGPIFTPPFSL